MKKCTYCGKEYPDDKQVCEIDVSPLVDFAPPPVTVSNQSSSKWWLAAAFIKKKIIAATFVKEKILFTILWMAVFYIIGNCIVYGAVIFEMIFHFNNETIGWSGGAANWISIGLMYSLPGVALILGLRGKLPGTQRREILAPTMTQPSLVPVPQKRKSTLATLSLVFSCCSFVFFIGTIAGIVCGHLAMREFKRNPELEGRNIAKWGLIIGYASIGLIPLLIVGVLYLLGIAYHGH